MKERPLRGVIARIKGIYTANGRFRGDMDSKISKYQSKYGEAGIHGLALALEDKYGQSPSGAATSSAKSKRPRQHLRIGEAKNPGPPHIEPQPRRRIRRRSAPPPQIQEPVASLGKGPGKISVVEIVLLDGTPCRVNLSSITRGSKHRWQTRELPNGRMVGPDKNSPREALHAWFRLHSKELHLESHEHLTKLLQDAVDEPEAAICPKPHIDVSQHLPATIEDAEGLKLQPQAAFAESHRLKSDMPTASAFVDSQTHPAPETPLTEEQIARLLRVRIATRRHVSLSCTSSWKRLVGQITTDPQLQEGLPLILPKLILSIPAEQQNPRQREQHVVQNLQLAQAQAWQTLYSRSMLHVQAIPQGHQSSTKMEETPTSPWLRLRRS